MQLPDNLSFFCRILLSGTTSWIYLALPFLWDSSFVSGWADPPSLPLRSQQPWSWVSALPWLLYLMYIVLNLCVGSIMTPLWFLWLKHPEDIFSSFCFSSGAASTQASPRREHWGAGHKLYFDSSMTVPGLFCSPNWWASVLRKNV